MEDYGFGDVTGPASKNERHFLSPKTIVVFFFFSDDHLVFPTQYSPRENICITYIMYRMYGIDKTSLRKMIEFLVGVLENNPHTSEVPEPHSYPSGKYTHTAEHRTTAFVFHN